VSSLAIVITDLHPPAVGDLRSGELPRLPFLERFLARSQLQAIAGDWRAWLQSDWLGLAPAAPAVVAAAALGVPPPAGSAWLATPLHRVAGLDTVRVHPEGLLWLGPDEQERLAADFARVFAGAGWTLKATGRRDLLLLGDAPLPPGVRSADPARWRGADPRAGYPRGEGAAALLRLGAEIEMWLHGHEVNAGRAARGELPVDALWLWGGEAPEPVRGTSAAAGSARRAIQGADLYTRGLAARAGLRLLDATEGLPDLPDADLAVVIEIAGGGRAALEQIDARWIARALDQAGRRRQTLLCVAGRVARLPGGPWRRLGAALRPGRPWWEQLA
jgi:hypothetical protein